MIICSGLNSKKIDNAQSYNDLIFLCILTKSFKHKYNGIEIILERPFSFLNIYFSGLVGLSPSHDSD